MTAAQTEIMLQQTGNGQAWIPLEQVLPRIRPREEPIYRVGMLVGHIDLLLTIACSN